MADSRYRKIYAPGHYKVVLERDLGGFWVTEREVAASMSEEALEAARRLLSGETGTKVDR